MWISSRIVCFNVDVLEEHVYKEDTPLFPILYCWLHLSDSWDSWTTVQLTNSRSSLLDNTIITLVSGIAFRTTSTVSIPKWKQASMRAMLPISVVESCIPHNPDAVSLTYRKNARQQLLPKVNLVLLACRIITALYFAVAVFIRTINHFNLRTSGKKQRARVGVCIFGRGKCCRDKGESSD